MSATGSDRVLLLLGSLEPSESLRSTLALLDWSTRTPGSPTFRAITRHGGSAEARLRTLARTSIVFDPHGWTLPRLAQRARLPRAAAALRSLDLRLRLRTTRPVYVADAAAAGLLHRLGPGAGPVVTHLHATEQAFAELVPADRAVLLARTDRWVVGSEEKRALLVGEGVPDDRIALLPDLLDLPGTGEAGPDLADEVRRDLRERHGIPEDARLAIGIGAADWWTVPDAFVRVAWEAARRSEGADLRFLWVAEGASDRMLWPLRHDIDHAGLADRVHVEQGERPTWHHLAAADVLLSTRLDDAAPAGLREAAIMQRPVLRFDDPEASSPGLPQVPGAVVPFLDLDALVDALVAIERSPQHRAAEPMAGAPWLPTIGGPDLLAQLRPG